ncbi:MAG: phosphate starvation-inducible protein PhoH [Candidatus Anoxymicrobium japonicum]|uniref:PhoH-like protein n=1 Tax=Candidatus Anoxymicrobium japonicum TaxID=2013648 RepID=A0A2N3G7D4_9ACTN|nr:MAG: phosphate starvation-inducible protein PhoH [Candidatus Anoxymicrobium japonicum]
MSEHKQKLSDVTEVKIVIPHKQAMVSLLGQGDRFLKIIEESFDCRIVARGNEIDLNGSASETKSCTRLFEELVELLEEGLVITDENLAITIDMVRRGEILKSTQVFKDVVLTTRGKIIRPRTPGQKRYVEMMRKSTIVFSIGPAGTGKTYLALAYAVQCLLDKKVNRLVLTRPAIEAGEKLGFLPGDICQKVDPYLRPLYDALYEMLGAEKFHRMLDRGSIEVAPLAFMRGRTLNDSFVILDEAQNTSPEQMKMFLTRLGFASRAVITGDVTQVDLPREIKSGLLLVSDILQKIEGVSFVSLDACDVVRHKIVQQIVEAYKEYELRNGQD